MKTKYHLALGSNQGNRRRQLTNGLYLLSRFGTILKTSSVYITRPEGMDSPCLNFFNMACLYEFNRPPKRLLCLCKAIEQRCGRLPDSHNQPRPLDIDILLAGSLQIKSSELHIPHPGIINRPFVLLPLVEIDADLADPLSGSQYGEIVKPLQKSGILGRFRLPQFPTIPG